MTPTAKTKTEPAKPNRMTLSQVVERMTDRSARSSVTIKMSAQGVLMPDVTIVSGESDEAVTKMIEQAVSAFTDIVSQANGAK